MSAFVKTAIATIRAYRKMKGWSINRLATEAAITQSTIQNIDSTSWNPRSETLVKLEAIIPDGVVVTPDSDAAE